MFELFMLPFRAVFGIAKLGLDLFFGLFHGVFGLVFGLVFGILGLVGGLFSGLFELAFVAAMIAFIAHMYRKGRDSVKKPAAAPSNVNPFDEYIYNTRAR